MRNTLLVLFLFCTTILAISCSNDTDTQTTTTTLLRPLGLVSDYDSLLTFAQIDTLHRMIYHHEKRTTDQIAIITIDSIPHTYSTLGSYSLAIANHWGVGTKEYNNGVVIALCATCRQIEIQNGTGTELRLTNHMTQQIIDSHMIPQLKESNYFLALQNGLTAIIDTLTTYPLDTSKKK